MKDKFNLVGTKIKEFSLPNSRNETRNISEFEGNKNVLLVLFRNRNWPYSKAHSKNLAKDFDKFNELNTEIYAILPDKLEKARLFESEFAVRYPIYYDDKKKVNKMLKQEIKPSKFGRMPVLLILDKQGIIRYAYYSDSMDDIPKNEEIFNVIENLNK